MTVNGSLTLPASPVDCIRVSVFHGFIALLDPEDADLAERKWHAILGHNGRSYYARTTAAGKAVAMHKIVAERMGLDLAGKEIDHRNRRGLDNRRSNLRAATKAQNACNRSVRRDSGTGLKGVSFNRQMKKFTAQIWIGGTNRVLGYFDNIIDAAVAYDRVAYATQGEFAWGNYPPFACGYKSPK